MNLSAQHLSYIVILAPLLASILTGLWGKVLGKVGSHRIAITLLGAEEKHLLEPIQTLFEEPLMRQWLPGFEPSLDADFSTSKPNKKSAKKSKGKRSKARSR